MLSRTSFSSTSPITSLGPTNSFKPNGSERGSQTSLAALFTAGSNSPNEPTTTNPEEDFYPAPDPLNEQILESIRTDDAEISSDEFLAGIHLSPPDEQSTANSGLVSNNWNEVSSLETQSDNSNTSPAESQPREAFPAFSGNTVLSNGEQGLLKGIVDGISVRNDTPTQLKERIINYGPATVVKGMHFPLKAIIEKGSDEHLTAFLSALGKRPYRKELQTYMNTLASAGNGDAIKFLIANRKVRQALGSWGNSVETPKKSTFYSQLLATAAENTHPAALANLLSCEHITRHLPPSCYNELMSTLLNAAQPDPELITAMLKSDVCQKNLTKETLTAVATYLLQNQPNNKEAYTAFIYCRLAHKFNSATIDNLLTLYTTAKDHNSAWSTWLLKQAWRSSIPPQTIGKLMVRFSKDNNKEVLDMLLQFSTLKKMDEVDKQNIIANMVVNKQEDLLLSFEKKASPSMDAYAMSIDAIANNKMDRLMKAIAGHYRRQPFRLLLGSKQDALTNALHAFAGRMSYSSELSSAMKDSIMTILPRKNRPEAWKSR